MTDRPRVLLIDDSEFAVMITREVLERDGFEVRAASSVGEFDAMLQTWSPNIVLADVNMPGVSGPQLCKSIKLRMETVPVVLYSELPEAQLSALAKSSGADGFLSKSEGVERLSEQLAALCEEIVW
jgi:two-component system, OmpR family, response regulator